jgi:hypothetical protein
MSHACARARFAGTRREAGGLRTADSAAVRFWDAASH